jgi:hypothetical protein
MSPVEICGTPYFSMMKFACVPLPAPGAPRRMMRMLNPLKIMMIYTEAHYV